VSEFGSLRARVVVVTSAGRGLRLAFAGGPGSQTT
jgi:hypothetical protein